MKTQKPSRASRALSSARPSGRVHQRKPLARVSPVDALPLSVAVKISPATLAVFQRDQSTADRGAALAITLTPDMLGPLSDWGASTILNATPEHLSITLPYECAAGRSAEDNLARLSHHVTAHCIQGLRAEAEDFSSAVQAMVADSSALISVADYLIDQERCIVAGLQELIDGEDNPESYIDLHDVFRAHAGKALEPYLPEFHALYQDGFTFLDASRLEPAFMFHKKPAQSRYKAETLDAMVESYWRFVAYTSFCLAVDAIGKFRDAPWPDRVLERRDELQRRAEAAASTIRQRNAERRAARVRLLADTVEKAIEVTRDKSLMRSQKLGFDVAPYYHSAIKSHLLSHIGAIEDSVAASLPGTDSIVLRARFYTDDEAERFGEREHLSKVKAPHPVTLEVMELIDDLRSAVDGGELFAEVANFTFSVHAPPSSANAPIEYLQIDGLWPHGFAPDDAILVIEIELPEVAA